MLQGTAHSCGVCVQLDESFSVVLSSHSTPASRLGDHREVNITIRRNDDPFGLIEFLHWGLLATIKESREDDVHSGTGKSEAPTRGGVSVVATRLRTTQQN